ncbi:MAG: hypothetical protein E6J47_02065 [Chloroflexi bacterium]|nr:MAG: hypothetical protein E6J47_02065 [Chloroflexota bacterium]
MTAPQGPARRGSSGAVVLGAVLIALGLIFFVGQQLNVDLADAAWPFYVIAPGLALVAFGLTQARGSGLAIAGSMVTMIGLVLLYQNATDHWESWAYAWALVAPGGSGIGMLLYGTRSGDARMARDGFFTIVTAIGLFAAGLVFFEGILGISGERLPLPQWALPVAIIVIGLLLLLRGFTARRVFAEPSPSSPSVAEPPDSEEEPAQSPPAT